MQRAQDIDIHIYKHNSEFGELLGMCVCFTETDHYIQLTRKDTDIIMKIAPMYLFTFYFRDTGFRCIFFVFSYCLVRKARYENGTVDRKKNTNVEHELVYVNFLPVFDGQFH